MELTEEATAIKGLQQVLEALGADLEDENLKGTPKRVLNYLVEHFGADRDFAETLEKCKLATFPSEYDGIVAVENIEVFGICPHHLLPVIYRISVAYIPTKRVIGLSKLARLTEACGKQPVLQEDLTKILADTFSDLLETDNVAVLVKGVHMCMIARGVTQKAKAITSEMRGSFFDDDKARGEFFRLVENGGEIFKI